MAYGAFGKILLVACLTKMKGKKADGLTRRREIIWSFMKNALDTYDNIAS